MNYKQFLEKKAFNDVSAGFDIELDQLHDRLFDFQKTIVKWALARGRGAVFADTGLGKEQPYSANIMTPYGFKKMGSLSIGDLVIGADGKSTKVLKIFEQGIKDVYELTFKDGTKTTCGIEHLWNVRTRVQKKRGDGFKTKSLKEILDYKKTSYDKRYPDKEYIEYKYHIPINDPVEFNPSDETTIDPYLLGLLIGDGGLSNTGVKITTSKDRIIKKVQELLPDGDKIGSKSDITYSIVNADVSNQPSKTKLYLMALGLHGKLSKEKFIPKNYLHSTIKDRELLLQGLLDTDGHVINGSTNEYSTSSSKLSEDIAYLARSLGYMVRITERISHYTKNGEKHTGFKNYRIYIYNTNTTRLKTIVNIEKVSQEKSRCILVDNKDHLYLTDDFIVTHNTNIQCEWSKQVQKKTKGSILIFAPLAVALQTVNEAKKIDLEVFYVRDQDQVNIPGVYITNYEMIDHFDLDQFIGVVLDESSILKSQTGKYRTNLINQCRTVPYRLSCTATPSPNDFMELGNQSDFLGVMTQSEMLAMFFVNDTGDTGTWRLKKHGKDKFWEWLSTWSVVIRIPSDLGFDDTGYKLPPLNLHEIVIKSPVKDGQLFSDLALTLQERRQAKKDTLKERCEKAAEIVNKSDDQWIIWCNLNAEQDLLKSLIDDCASVQGSDKTEHKINEINSFLNYMKRNIVSKSSILGYGLNMQQSNNMIFVGIDDSFEKFYQAVRRQYRFGQKKEVNVYIIRAESEGSIMLNLKKKQKQHNEISESMVKHMRDLMKQKVTGIKKDQTIYNANVDMLPPKWL